MFSHVFVGVSDFSRALAFYRALMPVLGVQERFCEPERPWAGWQSSPDPRPYLLIGSPFEGQPHAPGNGQNYYGAYFRDTEGNKLCVACHLPPTA